MNKKSKTIQLLIFNSIICFLGFTHICSANHEPNVGVDLFTYSVSIYSDIYCERPTICLYTYDYSTTLYVGEGISQEMDNGKYLISFDPFDVDGTIVTGKYILRIGGASLERQDLIVDFVNNDDRIRALCHLSVADFEEISQILIDSANVLQLDVTKYKLLSQEWKHLVNEEIVALDLAVDQEKDPYLAVEKQKLLSDLFNKKMELILLCTETDLTEVIKLINNAKYIEFDMNSYYKQIGYDYIAQIFMRNNFSSNNITVDLIVDSFDGAVLLGAIKKLDWETAKEAISYYSDKGLIDFSFDDYIVSVSNLREVMGSLKLESFNSYLDIPEKLCKLLSKYDNNQGEASNGVNVTTGKGGGGNSTYAIITEKPTEQPTEHQLYNDKFIDLDGVDWSKIAIEKLYELKVIDGYGDGKFMPNNYVTREEFVKMIVMAFEIYNDNAESNFNDVLKSEWYYKYVSSAFENGIVKGNNHEVFGVGLHLSRQDMAVMLKRVLSEYEIKSNGEAIIFNDFEEVDAYAKEAVSFLSSHGIINGMGNRLFVPLENVTRAQCAKAIYESLILIGGRQ